MNKEIRNSIITQKNYNDLELQSYDFTRSNIFNVTLTQSVLSNCIFDRSSIVSLKVNNCIFKNCRFINIDLKTCKFVNCNFVDCNFSLANILENIFENCLFEKINFTGASLRENDFNKADMINLDLNGSGTTLNCFCITHIKDSIFGDCTIEFNIMKDCIIENSKINIETLGSVYGINKNSLRNVSFLLLGETVEETFEDICKKMRDDIINEQRIIELFVYDVCIGELNVIDATDQLINDLQYIINNNRYLTGEESTFLFNVFKELYNTRKLPFIALYRLCQNLRKMIDYLKIDNKHYEIFLLLSNHLVLIQNAMLADLLNDELFNIHKSNDSVVTTQIIFNKKPDINIVEAFDQIYEYINGEKPKTIPTLISEEQGSYIVVLQIILQSVLALKLFLFLVNGCVKDLTKIRTNFEVLISKKNLPKKYILEVTKHEENNHLKEIVQIISGLTNKSIPPNILELVKKGINADNIKEILI